MQGNLGKKTALPFRWVTAGRTQRNHKGKLCSDLAMEWTGCTHKIHTSHSTHSSCLSTASWMPKQKMNLQKPAQPAQNLQTSQQAAPKLLLWMEAVLPMEGSFLLCCQSHLRSHGKNLRQRPVGDPIVTFHNPARAVTEPTAKATEGTMDRQPVLSSNQPSSQSTQLLGIHLLDVPWGHPLCPTDRFGYRNQPSSPML